MVDSGTEVRDQNQPKIIRNYTAMATGLPIVRFAGHFWAKCPNWTLNDRHDLFVRIQQIFCPFWSNSAYFGIFDLIEVFRFNVSSFDNIFSTDAFFFAFDNPFFRFNIGLFDLILPKLIEIAYYNSFFAYDIQKRCINGQKWVKKG